MLFKEKPLEQLLKENKISQNTFDKVKIVKKYIEKKYNLKTIYNMELNSIFSKINNSNLNNIQKSEIKSKIISKETEKFRHKREKISIHDYESLAILGRGAFGEIHLCREKISGKIYAVKKIKKEILLLKNQVIHSRNEQLVLSKIKSPWIVELKASFQEEDYLFLIMEFLPGGDLMTLLIERDTFTEEEAKFYIAELICCLESIHKLDCIHRDIKPDNILIDKNGHIKLSDFGLAKVSDKLYELNNFNLNNLNSENNHIKIEDNNEKKHEKNYSCVGTAYYVAPEVLNKNGYGPEVDWWSVGVIFYEMLIGYAPFCSKDTSEVCQKILNWEKYLKFPKKISISDEAKDLIKKLINSSNKRLGKNGVDEIKKHKFFDNLDWENLRNLQAPFIPELKNEYDTKYFDVFEPIEPFYPPKRKKKKKDIEFIGYTYNNSDEEKQNEINREYVKIIDELDNINNNNNIIKTSSSNQNNNLSNDNTYETSCLTNENNNNNNNNKINKKFNNIVIINSKNSNNNNNNNNNKNKNILNKIKIHIKRKKLSPSPNRNLIKNKIGIINFRNFNSSGKKYISRLLIKSISENKFKKSNYLSNNKY
jgi:serine/threonine kinase 38